MREKIDFWNGIVGLGTLVFLATWAVAIVTWIASGELSETAVQLVQYAVLAQCVCCASYCCRNAYGNKKGESGCGSDEKGKGGARDETEGQAAD